MPNPAPPAGTDRYLTVAEVAERLRTTPVTVARMCRASKLPATKPAGTWLISERELEIHMKKKRNKHKDAA